MQIFAKILFGKTLIILDDKSFGHCKRRRIIRKAEDTRQRGHVPPDQQQQASRGLCLIYGGWLDLLGGAEGGPDP